MVIEIHDHCLFSPLYLTRSLYLRKPYKLGSTCPPHNYFKKILRDLFALCAFVSNSTGEKA
jgi:hypothetical protein